MRPSEVIQSVGSVVNGDFKRSFSGEGQTEILINCPFCYKNGRGRDTKKHLSLNTTTLRWQCFRCGERSKGPGLLFRELGIPYAGNDEIIVRGRKEKGKESKPIPRPLFDKFYSFGLKVYDKNFQNKEMQDTFQGELYRYLRRNRKLPHRLIKEGKFGCTPYHPNKIVIPITGYDQKVLTYQTRTTKPNAKPKYWGPAAVQDGVRYLTTKETLFGEHRVTKEMPILLCEGVFDAIWFPNGLATFGKTMTKIQLRRVRRLSPTKVYLGYDKGTERETRALQKQLDAFFETEIIHSVSNDFDLDFRDKVRNPAIERYLEHFDGDTVDRLLDKDYGGLL